MNPAFFVLLPNPPGSQVRWRSFFGTIENVGRDRLLVLLLGSSFLGRVVEIHSPFLVAYLDFLGNRNSPFDMPAPIPPAIGRANIVDAPVVVHATLFLAFHDSRNIPCLLIPR